jgi:hypothetical protein
MGGNEALLCEASMEPLRNWIYPEMEFGTEGKIIWCQTQL